MMVIKLLSEIPNRYAKLENIVYIGYEDNIPVLYNNDKEIFFSKEQCQRKKVLNFEDIKKSYNYYVLTPEEIQALKIELL